MATSKRTYADRVNRYVYGRRTGATRGEIARATGIPLRSVSDAVRSLRSRGYVTVAGKRARAGLVHAVRMSPFVTGGF